MKTSLKTILDFLETRRKPVLVAVWILYLVLGLTVIHAVDTAIEEPSDAFYFVQIAKNIAAGKGYVEIYNHAYRPPLFSAYLSVFALLGATSMTAFKLAALMLCSLSIFIVYRLCRALFGGVSGIAGAVLFVCFPWFLTLPDYLISENMFIPLFLFVLLLVARALAGPSIKRFALAGIASGFAALCREITVYLPLILLVVLLVHHRKRSAHGLRYVLVFTLLQVAVITPWTIRNYRIFGEFVPISTNAWINLYIGNNPKFENIYDFRWTLPEGTKWNVREQPGGEDEHEAMTRSRDEALSYIRAEPSAFVSRTLKKAWRFVTPHFDLIGKLGRTPLLKVTVTANLLLYTLFLLCFLSYLVLHRKKLFSTEPFLFFSLLAVLYMVLIAAITYTNSRYRLPLTTVCLVYAASWVNTLAVKFAGENDGAHRAGNSGPTPG
jgi:4-amino-4-deoxy-L-arabinose transferase-like glycosyltransferase